jgi:transposase InsO family protein
MPFKEVCRVEQRVRMLADYDTGVFDVSELCARYGVSRDVFYDWRRRRESGVVDWFLDRSHAPHSCPHRTPAGLIAPIVAVKRRFGHFGPKKVRAWLMREDPGRPWPAASTIGDILKQAGLVESVPRRRRRVPQPVGGVVAQEANDEWAIDFKGWVRTGDGRRCDPLTLSDTVSRYLLEARIGAVSTAWVRPVLERAFREYGLPRAIRSDNGPPFGSNGAGGLTRLSAWWLRLGIAPHFIPPGAPQNNGRLERLHRTMAEQATAQRAATAAELQERIDAFRRHYNQERPHEALDQDQPAVRWRPSPRPMPDRLDDPVYGPDYDVRRVRQNGYIKWKGDGVFIGQALTGELVGIVQRDDNHHIVQFCGLALGAINPTGTFLRFAPIRHGLRKAQEPPNAAKVSTINPVYSVDHHPG